MVENTKKEKKFGSKKERKIPLSFSLTQSEIDVLDGLVNRIETTTGAKISRSQLVAEVISLLASPSGAKMFSSAFDLGMEQLSFLDENLEAYGSNGSAVAP